MFVKWQETNNYDKKRQFIRQNGLDGFVLKEIEAQLYDMLKRLNMKPKINTFLRTDRLQVAICGAFFKNFSYFVLTPKSADVKFSFFNFQSF